MKSAILLFLISYTILFILYYFIYYRKGLKKKSLFNSIQFEFLKVRFGFKKNELNQKKVGLIICFIDPLIISLSGTIVTLPKWSYAIALPIGFILLMALIYSFYEILGRILKAVNKK